MILRLLFFCAMLTLAAAAPKQLLKTSLQVVVRNELGNEEAGVTVALYKSKEDYEKHVNPATEPLKTDKKGKVNFKELDPVIYFISAEKGDKNNVGGGEQTTKLQENRINKLTVVITE